MSNNRYSVKKTIGRLLHNVNRCNPKLYLPFSIYTIAAGIYPLLGVILPKLLLTELAKGSDAGVQNILLIAGGFFLAVALLGFVKSWLVAKFDSDLTLLRLDYIGDITVKLTQMQYRNMEDSYFWEHWQKAMAAPSSNGNGIEGVYHKLFETPAVLVTIVIMAVIIASQSPLILLGLIVNVAVIVWIGRRQHRYQFSKKEELAKRERKVAYYNTTTYDFNYGKDIRTYQVRDRILRNYSAEIKGYAAVHRMIRNHEYHLGFLALFGLLISDGITYFILIKRVLDGMSIADFSMYLGIVVALSVLLKTAADDIIFIFNEGEYVSEYFRLIDTDYHEVDKEVPAVVDDTLEIEFCDVSFKYPGSERYIFKNLNFTIHKGERLAIVGINGAGKSTLVKLMTGLFDVTEGEIRINGMPLKAYDRQALYSMYSVVFQECLMLSYTIRENIACSLNDIDDDRVEEVLRKVGLWEKVNAYPQKTHQRMLKIFDEEGALMSGGETQKMAIARALYKGGSMVIMDEPTAALDALAEAAIYEDFSSLVKDKTAVYISHRLASTKFCDKIALFDENGLREYGSHEELMELQGEYCHMFTVQGKYYTQGGVADEGLAKA